MNTHFFVRFRLYSTVDQFKIFETIKIQNLSLPFSISFIFATKNQSKMTTRQK
jgi:hypothetical protein